MTTNIAAISAAANTTKEFFEIKGHRNTTLDIFTNQAYAIKSYVVDYLSKMELKPAYVDKTGKLQPAAPVRCKHYSLWYHKNGCKMQIYPTASVKDYS